MQKFKPVQSKIKATYKKSSFMRKPRLINVLYSYRTREAMCEFQFACCFFSDNSAPRHDIKIATL